MGFYYKWEWDNGVDTEWLQARAAWRKYVRRITRGSYKYDTELLVYTACSQGELISHEWELWSQIKDRANPRTIPVWGTDSVLLDSIYLAEEIGNTIIWFDQRAVGERLGVLKKDWPLYKGGNMANNLLTNHVNKQRGPCIASIKAHCFGVNLQAFSDGIILTPPSSGSTWEQLLGRCHRSGQKSDEVIYHTYQHSPELGEAFEQAKRNARYIELSTGQRQKLNYASII